MLIGLNEQVQEISAKSVIGHFDLEIYGCGLWNVDSDGELFCWHVTKINQAASTIDQSNPRITVTCLKMYASPHHQNPRLFILFNSIIRVYKSK